MAIGQEATMAKKRKAKNYITPEQIAARKQEEQRHKQADEVMANLKIGKSQYLGVSIWKNITIQLARGKTSLKSRTIWNEIRWSASAVL